MSRFLVDTGVLVAAASKTDNRHAECAALLAGSDSADMLVPSSVLTEACYMIGDRAGRPDLEAVLLENVAAGDLQLVELTSQDLYRSAELVRKYSSLPLGFTDASIFALSERLGVRTIATIDVTHFSIVRPHHCRTQPMTLVP